MREIREQLLIGIWESLGLDGHDMNKALNIENGLLILAANLYPPCPQPELAIGLPPHSDHGLLTILIQNGIGGLQLECKGKWVNVNAIPNSFLVNICDNLEVYLHIFICIICIYVQKIYDVYIYDVVFLVDFEQRKVQERGPSSISKQQKYKDFHSHGKWTCT